MSRLVICALAVILAGVAFAPVAMASPAKARRAAPMADQRHLFELGLYGGNFFPSAEHELYALSSGQRPFSTVSGLVGGRVAYLPIPFMGVELEGGVMPTRTTGAQNALVYGFRGHLLVQYPARIAPFLLIGGGLLGVASGAEAVGDDVDGAYHIGWGIKVYPYRWLALRLDGRQHISGQVGPGGRASHHELLIGAAYVFGWKLAPPPPPPAPPPPAPKDSDGDGLWDRRDKCPKQYAKTPDGCPIKDSDGDGLPDGVDRCPKQYAKTADGCPIKDTDKDGLSDDNDRCPTQYAKTADGCPDTDGDGYPDDKDACPKVAENFDGYKDEDGCPEQIPRLVKRFSGVMRGIYFATGKAEIRRGSFALLDRAVKVLQGYPEMLLTIRGHTDKRGTAQYNLDLSQRRADAVRQYLVQKGVAARRIGTEGVGYNEPMASNRTRRGRALNRRIEFKLGQPKEENLVPAPASAPATPAPAAAPRPAPKPEPPATTGGTVTP